MNLQVALKKICPVVDVQPKIWKEKIGKKRRKNVNDPSSVTTSGPSHLFNFKLLGSIWTVGPRHPMSNGTIPVLVQLCVSSFSSRDHRRQEPIASPADVEPDICIFEPRQKNRRYQNVHPLFILFGSENYVFTSRYGENFQPTFACAIPVRSCSVFSVK